MPEAAHCGRRNGRRNIMRAIALWVLGVPLWIVIMLALFTDWV